MDQAVNPAHLYDFGVLPGASRKTNEELAMNAIRYAEAVGNYLIIPLAYIDKMRRSRCVICGVETPFHWETLLRRSLFVVDERGSTDDRTQPAHGSQVA